MLDSLNPPQRAAVLHTEGPLLVLAGAGSGKTRVIVEKIAHLIGSGRYPARRIAAITFTNKSAKEMRERVAKRIRGDGAEGLTICTFHALGLKFLQFEHARLGLRRGSTGAAAASAPAPAAADLPNDYLDIPAVLRRQAD